MQEVITGKTEKKAILYNRQNRLQNKNKDFITKSL